MRTKTAILLGLTYAAVASWLFVEYYVATGKLCVRYLTPMALSAVCGLLALDILLLIYLGVKRYLMLLGLTAVSIALTVIVLVKTQNMLYHLSGSAERYIMFQSISAAFGGDRSPGCRGFLEEARRATRSWHGKETKQKYYLICDGIHELIDNGQMVKNDGLSNRIEKWAHDKDLVFVAIKKQCNNALQIAGFKKTSEIVNFDGAVNEPEDTNRNNE
ncbi:hypothetical protein HZA56_05210 [Candidatus Poribacteria bacterium]|nr:hypothetical protein [Candidatus Poribacteria bacterium]